MGAGLETSSALLDATVRIVQTALTPVFLLSAIATLLNVFSVRLGRLSDHVDRLATDEDLPPGLDREAELLAYRRRSLLLDAAVVLAGLGGVGTCIGAFALFVGSLRNENTANILLVAFGSSVLLTLAALVAFVFEMLLTSRRLMRQVLRITGEG